MSHESCDAKYESHQVRVEGRTHYKKGAWAAWELEALSPLWSLLRQGPHCALHSWAPRDPPPGPVVPNPMGSPASPPPPETSRPRAGKCLTTQLLHLGAGPPHTTCPSFSTTASGAGMCFFPCLTLLLQLSAPLIYCVYKIPRFGVPASRPF